MLARDILLTYSSDILDWIKKKDSTSESVLYSSIDVRESKFKIAPVDINLFPSGFNNFSDKIDLLRDSFRARFGSNLKIGLLVENFTRNKNYLDNVNVLKNSLNACQLLTIDPDSMKVIKFSDNKELVDLDNFDLIVLNNDLNSYCPHELLNRNVIPNPKLGWHKRRKNVHLGLYNQLIDEMFSDLKLDADPWVLKTIIDRCENVDFRNKTGLSDLSEKVEKVLTMIEKKYEEHSITDCKPHVFVKANNGTFGMGIMIVQSPDEILSINKKTRHSMSTLKHGINNLDVVIQEGIPTNIKMSNAPSENVLYSVNDEIIGSLIRFNQNKDDMSNLNSAGMEIMKSDKIDVVDIIISKLCNLTSKIELSLL
jgi:glutamate--cysteine ligase